eukprot:scaffold1235_cov358-Prasinococcus_capsulatus_cf.AAC.15
MIRSVILPLYGLKVRGHAPSHARGPRAPLVPGKGLPAGPLPVGGPGPGGEAVRTRGLVVHGSTQQQPRRDLCSRGGLGRGVTPRPLGREGQRDLCGPHSHSPPPPLLQPTRRERRAAEIEGRDASRSRRLSHLLRALHPSIGRVRARARS